MRQTALSPAGNYGFAPNTPAAAAAAPAAEPAIITDAQGAALKERGYQLYRKSMIKADVMAAMERGERPTVKGVLLWRDPLRGVLTFNVELIGQNQSFGEPVGTPPSGRTGVLAFENLDEKAKGKPRELYTFTVMKRRMGYDWILLKGPAVAPGARLLGGARHLSGGARQSRSQPKRFTRRKRRYQSA